MLEEAIAREILLEHSARPRGEGAPQHFDHSVEHTDASSGDQVRIWVSLQKGALGSIHWQAVGSGVLKASCSLMSERLTGLELAQGRQVIEAFVGMLTSSQPQVDWALLGDAAALAGLRHLPARVRCASLPWRAMEALLQCALPRTSHEDAREWAQ